FSGNQTSLNTYFFEIIDRACPNVQQVASTFPFTASTRVINDCTISATDLNFPPAGVLEARLDGTATLNVRCTNANAYQVTLSGGASGNIAARAMQRVGGGGTVSYQLYTSAARSVIWGDGTRGTAPVTATGSGLEQTLTVYGSVPPQATPMPGTYRDTIIAT